MSGVVALKNITLLDQQDEVHAAKEVHFLRLLQGHPQIVRLHDVCCESDMSDKHTGDKRCTKIVLVCESCLMSLRDFSRSAAGCPAGWAEHVLGDILQGMQHVQSHSILHRDLKPANLLLAPGDTPGQLRVRIADFGSAMQMDHAGSDATAKSLTWQGREVVTTYQQHRYAWPCDSDLGK